MCWRVVEVRELAAESEKSRRGFKCFFAKASLSRWVMSLVKERASLEQLRITDGMTSREPNVVIPQRSSKMFMQILSLDFASFSSLAVASTIGLLEDTPSIK